MSKKVKATSQMQKTILSAFQHDNTLRDAKGRRIANAGFTDSVCYKSAVTLANKYPEVFTLQYSEYFQGKLDRGEPFHTPSWDLVLLKPEALGLK